MASKKPAHLVLNSLSALHDLLGLPKPEHPLISVMYSQSMQYQHPEADNVVINFYAICIKEGFKGKVKYGQRDYDFSEGVMAFQAPGQVSGVELAGEQQFTAQWVLFHPDLLHGYPLAKTIKDYGFFSYAVNEALHLSEKEKATIASILLNIEQEYHANIDHFSQDVMVSNLDLLLSYCNRFYNRQFITRKKVHHDLLSKFEGLLSDYFNSDKVQQAGLPSVQDISAQLNVSPNYLSDMLRTLTGQGAQQHIHNKVIEKAKEFLTTSKLSVGEIAYELGFEHPQSFNKLFKTRTGTTPLAFRAMFN
jgi:AraC family transcriptional regulator, transcriptional activator of pobA